jgi:hypothetical protein
VCGWSPESVPMCIVRLPDYKKALPHVVHSQSLTFAKPAPRFFLGNQPSSSAGVSLAGAFYRLTNTKRQHNTIGVHRRLIGFSISIAETGEAAGVKVHSRWSPPLRRSGV